MPGSLSSSLSTSAAAAAAATIATTVKQRRQQQQQQQHSKNLQQKLVYRINGLPALSLGTILIAAVSIINCFAILQTNALNISIATAENHTALQQQQQQQQQQQNLQLHPQQQELEERQQQSQLLAAIEKTLTINHTLKSFSIIDVARTAAAVAAVIETEAEVDKQPVFDFGMPRNITTRTGQAEATIKCRVNHLNDKSVSWIRKRDLHILTVATSSYTSDKRFEATQTKDAREWTLHVKAPQPRDSGIYECQVNTEPKMSMAFQLNIIVTSPDAKAIISGPPDLHFKVGSAIILNCIVQQPSFKDIGPIYWYRGEQMLTPLHKQLDEENAVADDDDDVAVTVAVDGQSNSNSVDDVERDITNDVTKDFVTRIAMESQLGDTLKSRLRISNAQTTDTGNYTCQPTTASSASVMVHVINDENPAAMQKSRATALCSAINIIAAAVTMTDITAKVAPLFCWLSTIVVIVVAIAVLVLAVYSDVDFMGGGGIGHISHLLFIGKMSKNFFLFEVTTHNIETAIRIMRNFERKCISLTLK